MTEPVTTQFMEGYSPDQPIADLYESPQNPREISDERYEALKHSIEKDPKMMEARPLIATLEGEVVCGNMRLRVCKELGRETSPTYFRAFESEAEKREWMLRDNQEYGDWVPEDLAALVAAHRDDGADLQMLGFTESGLDSLLKMHDDDAGQGDGDGGNGDPGQPDVWGVIVDCETEEQQNTLLEELADRGLEVRALIP